VSSGASPVDSVWLMALLLVRTGPTLNRRLARRKAASDRAKRVAGQAGLTVMRANGERLS